MQVLNRTEVSDVCGGVDMAKIATGVIAVAEGAAIALAPEVSIPVIIAAGILSGSGAELVILGAKS